MKKSNFKSLQLNKKAICSLDSIKGGIHNDCTCTCHTCETYCNQAACCTCTCPKEDPLLQAPLQ